MFDYLSGEFLSLRGKSDSLSTKTSTTVLDVEFDGDFSTRNSHIPDWRVVHNDDEDSIEVLSEPPQVVLHRDEFVCDDRVLNSQRVVLPPQKHLSVIHCSGSKFHLNTGYLVNLPSCFPFFIASKA